MTSICLSYAESGDAGAGSHIPAVSGRPDTASHHCPGFSAETPSSALPLAGRLAHTAETRSRHALFRARGVLAGRVEKSGNTEVADRAHQMVGGRAVDSAPAAGGIEEQRRSPMDARQRHAMRERSRARREASHIITLRRLLTTPVAQRSGLFGSSWLRMHPTVSEARGGVEGARGDSSRLQMDLVMGRSPVVLPASTQPEVITAAASRIREAIECRQYCSVETGRATSGCECASSLLGGSGLPARCRCPFAERMGVGVAGSLALPTASGSLLPPIPAGSRTPYSRCRHPRETTAEGSSRGSPRYTPLGSVSQVPYLVVTAAECMLECSPRLRRLTRERLHGPDPDGSGAPRAAAAENGPPPRHGGRGPSGSTIAFQDVVKAFPVVAWFVAPHPPPVLRC